MMVSFLRQLPVDRLRQLERQRTVTNDDDIESMVLHCEDARITVENAPVQRIACIDERGDTVFPQTFREQLVIVVAKHDLIGFDEDIRIHGLGLKDRPQVHTGPVHFRLHQRRNAYRSNSCGI